MTMPHAFDRVLRLIGSLVWLLMLVAFFAEIGAILGWIVGDAQDGALIGVLVLALGLLWFAFRGKGGPRP